MDYGKSIFKIDRRYPAPELLESKRLLLECFALEQTKFEIVSRMLQRVSKSRNRKLLRKAKRAFISAVIHYNEVADKVSASLRTSVTHIDEGYIDYVLVDDIIPTLKRVVYEKDVVEVVGDKRRVIGERAAQPTSAYNIVFGAGVFNGGVGASVSTSAAEATSANSVASVEEPASAVAPEAFATSPVITAVPVSVPTRAVANVPVYVYNEGNGNELPCAPIKEVDEDGDVQPIRYSEARDDERSERTVPVNGVSYEQDPAFTQGGQNSSFNVPAHHTQYAQVPGTNDYVLTPTSNGRLTSDNKGGNYVAIDPQSGI